MALDPRYITDTSLLEYFVDKSTGYPLGGGVVSFWEDNARTIPKLVYELTGSPPNYAYTPLPNPIILSSVGTPQNNNGDVVAIYYYPFDALGNLQLYYVTVVNALGEEQFVRQAWPFNDANSVSPTPSGQVSVYNANQLKNSQFVAVLFNPAVPYVINIAGAGSYVFPIAPEWNLNVTATGATTVTVTRNSITGISAYPGNPPYTMTITPGANITSLSVSELLQNNPDIWSPQSIASTNGWLNGSILLAPGSSVMMLYAPSQGPSQLILNANNMTGAYTQFNHTVQLAPATNTDNSNVGFVNIVLQLPVAATTTFSNVQIVGLETNIPNIAYSQQTVNLQLANLAYYYFSNLINNINQASVGSYLIGWDFPLNPAQIFGFTAGPFATGANTSAYYWDQTIIFQSANSGVSIAQGPSYELEVTAAATTQFALIQYLESPTANKILNTSLSVMISALTSVVAGVNAKVTLWYTTAALPSLLLNQSLVATLDATGKPATFHGTWTEVPRGTLGDASLTIGTSATTNFNQYGFMGWNLNGVPDVDNATFFAIVVGTASVAMGNTVNFNSISLVPGNIPQIPAPKTASEVRLDCQRYFWSSFFPGQPPAVAVGSGTGEFIWPAVGTAGNNTNSPCFTLPTVLRTNYPTTILYNPVNANHNIYNEKVGLDCAGSTSHFTCSRYMSFQAATLPGGSSPTDLCSVHATFDARLGLV